MTDSINFTRLRANAAVDAAAGAARLRYITDVPGQQAVYMTKLNQAEAYIEAYAADPGTATAGQYIDAEAAVRGITALEMAELVVSVNSAWNSTIGPAIEAERMAGKLAVAAASTAEAIDAARTSAVEALESL